MAFHTRKSYSVSRNAYGIRIHLLDGTEVDFTLSPVSTGQDCLDRVAQVLDLDESYIFGLQYYDRTDHLRWIDLEKGIRKQLERKSSIGAKEPEVFFRVRFFPTDTSILQQEVSKYLLFLQLKESVLKGNLECNKEQAISLASFAVQAEFEDFDRKVHTDSHLSSFVLFPPHMQSSTNLADFVGRLSELYSKHRGMSQAAAELSYIRLAQQLKGYGHEGCQALDEDSNKLEIGASYVGVYVKHMNGMPTVYFKWPDIFSIKFRKKRLELEVRDEVIQFEMLSKESAEYAHNLIISQHHFYRLQSVRGVKLRGVGIYFKTQFEANRYSRAFSSRQSSLARKQTLNRSDSALVGKGDPPAESDFNPPGSMEMTTFKAANGSSSLQKIEEKETTLEVERVPVVEEAERKEREQNREKSVSPALSNPDTDDELDGAIQTEKKGEAEGRVTESRSKKIRISPTRTTLVEALQERLDSEEYLVEYDSIPKKFQDRPLVNLPLAEIKTKNRFKDIIPYDDTRVRLNPEENRTDSDYINANHISMDVGGGIAQHYIASQGPLASTAADFWQMMWENQARLIVMVTAEIENNRIKCHRYWPSEGGGDDSEVTHGNFHISSEYFNDTGTTITRGFILKHTPTQEARTIWHLQFVGWPDHGVPRDPESFLAFIDEIDTLRRHANNTSEDPSLDPPTVVHCSAGVGRTGVTIMMEAILKAIQKNESIDVPDVLRGLRTQRMALVQTPIQYKFCYEALLHFLSHSPESNRLI
ncbi:tyrosine-protein phosphatase non-receptor type 21-like [Oscarella lobularis]|uniref:tyrosine-protein phosphatase non-receptor type 21-like n=1 Tax=Oscarella lobularis TaxID=121494 RepID=UPI00331327A0